jgi:hypothetical protein
MTYRRLWCGGVLNVLVLTMALAAIAFIPANAQETTPSRRLDQVEVLPPDRRPARVPATTSDTGAESDQVRPLDAPSPPGSEQGY